jgi:HEAT repeat protein
MVVGSPTALEPAGPDSASLVAALQKLEPLLFVYVHPENSFLVDALWKITEKSGSRCVPHLAGALRETSPYARYLAATFLGAIGPEASGAERELARALRAPPEPGTLVSTARVQAIWALGRIGAAAGDAVPALIAQLEDEDEGVRLAAAAALRKIRPGRR